MQSYGEIRPDLKEAIQDPKRIFNQDETSVELGVGGQWVLAPCNTKQVYTQSSSTRDHVTVSYVANAAGDMVPPRVVFSGKRNLIKTKLGTMPSDGISGKWQFSYTENGWVQQDTFLEIVQDIVNYTKNNNIPTPVIIFIDGATYHLSLSISKLCQEEGIQPILLRPNSTHLLQPLDVTFYSSFKARLKVEQEMWHTNKKNIGNSLTKYTIIPLVYNVTENILVTKPLLLQNGFKKAGLFPWDPSAPNMNRTKPSQIYTEDDSSTIEKKSTKLKKSSGLSLEQSSPADTQTLFNEQEIRAVLSGNSSPPSQEHRLDSTRMDKSLSCDNSQADNLIFPYLKTRRDFSLVLNIC